MLQVRLGGNRRDSLVLTFLDAKLSVVEYDVDIHDLRTVSMHVFEVSLRLCIFLTFIHLLLPCISQIFLV